MEGGERDLYTVENLEACSYRFLQQTAKAMSLPSNVKKLWLIKLIYTKKHCSQNELDYLVKQVRLERQQHSLARKKTVRKKKHVQQSTEISSTTSNSQSPPIAHTPKRMNHIFIRYSPESHTPHKCRRTIPLKTNTLSASDRVLRSFKRIKKPYLLNNTLISVIKTSGLEEKSETRVNIVSKEEYQKINKTYVQRMNVSRCRNGGELVPASRSANIIPSSSPARQQRRLSGIYPLTSEDIKLPNVAVRRADGSLCKLNAIIQRPLSHKYNQTVNRGQSLLKLIDASNTPHTAAKACQTTPNFGRRTSNVLRKAQHSDYRATANTHRATNLPQVTSTFADRSSFLTDATSFSGSVSTNIPETTSTNTSFGYKSSYLPEVTSTFVSRSSYLPEVSNFDCRSSILPEITPSFESTLSHLSEVTSPFDYRGSNLPEVSSTFGYKSPNLPELMSNFGYRSPNLGDVTMNFEDRAPSFTEMVPDVGYRAPNNSMVDILQSNFNYSSSSEDANLSNMNKENQSEFTVYYHKKIRAEQVRSLRCRETARCLENGCQLPRISEVFSKFNSVYCKDVTQPIYVQVDSEPEFAPNPSFIPDPRTQYQGSSTLEKLYNLKSANPPLLQICSTNNTRTVYCTPVISTVKAQPSSTAVHDIYNTASLRDSQPYFTDEEIPRVRDFFRNFRCEDENVHGATLGFRNSTSSMETLTSQEQEQELGANVTIPEMVEDALEIISQDGDYMERMGMDVRTQCIFCNWAGPNMILEYHIRKEHSDEIIPCSSGSWWATYTLGGLAARRRWVSRVLDHAAQLYVLSALYDDPDCFMALLSTVSSDPDSPKSASMTIYNKVTGEPFTWSGDVTPLPPRLPDSAPHCFRLPLSRMDLLPNSANLKLVNRELVVQSPNKVVVGQPELDNIHISLMVKIFD